MAGDARAAKRREQRAAAAKKSSSRKPAGKGRGSRAQAAAPPDPPPPDAQETQPDGVLVTIARDGTPQGGYSINAILPLGDVRIGEVETILGKGLKVYRERAGVD